MSEPKFTKGPWQTINMSWEYSVIIDEDAARIAQVFIRDEVDEETQDKFEEIKDANANLIAAAPDLYEVLADMDDAFNDHLPESRLGMLLTWVAFEKARVALRKARGEAE